MIQVIRSASLPWTSLDAIDDVYEDAHLPTPTREEVEKCLNCTNAICTNCMESNPKLRVTGRPCGRPRKNTKQMEGQVALWAIGERIGEIAQALG